MFLKFASAQSNIQRASLTHVRMHQQMIHSFHMMHLNMMNRSSIKSVKKSLKHTKKWVTKYEKKLSSLEQKLANIDIKETKKHKKLDKRIGIYKDAIDQGTKKISELETLLQKQDELKAKKEAEELAKRKQN